MQEPTAREACTLIFDDRDLLTFLLVYVKYVSGECCASRPLHFPRPRLGVVNYTYTAFKTDAMRLNILNSCLTSRCQFTYSFIRLA